MESKNWKQTVLTEEAMLSLGGQLVKSVSAPCVIYLHGELGAGKTTLVRGFLRALGYQGVVKSPTYTLVESYELNEVTIFHFDLYRVRDPEELEFMGIRDYFHSRAICFVEWPEFGVGHIPAADQIIQIEFLPKGGRLVVCNEARNDGMGPEHLNL